MKSNNKDMQTWLKMIFLTSGVAFLSGMMTGSLFEKRLDHLELNHSETTFFSLLGHNLSVCFFILVIGGITGSIYSHIILFINGNVIGKLCAYLYSLGEMKQIVSGLLPHCIFEILGLVVFAVISVLPFVVCYKILKTGNFRPYGQCFRLFLQGMSVGVTLIVIAALIEANISMVDMKMDRRTGYEQKNLCSY